MWVQSQLQYEIQLKCTLIKDYNCACNVLILLLCLTVPQLITYKLTICKHSNYYNLMDVCICNYILSIRVFVNDQACEIDCLAINISMDASNQTNTICTATYI